MSDNSFVLLFYIGIIIPIFGIGVTVIGKMFDTFPTLNSWFNRIFECDDFDVWESDV